MAKAHVDWKVLSHGPITKLANNLWWVAGSLPGMSLKRTMTVVRKGNGELVLHNPVALEESAMGELEGWGTPRYLVVPSAFHRLDAPAFKKRYPAASVYAPSAARAKVEEVLGVDGTFEQFPSDDTVWFEPLAGVGGAEGAMLVRSEDGVSVVLNDVVFNMDRKRDLLGFLFTTVLGSAPGPRVSRLSKMLLVKDRSALRGDLLRFSELPSLARLIVAHEKVASGAAAREALRTAATYL